MDGERLIIQDPACYVDQMTMMRKDDDVNLVQMSRSLKFFLFMTLNLRRTD